MQRVPVVAAPSFGEIAVGIVEVPLPAAGTGIVAWSGLRIQPQLRHQPSADVLVVKVAADAELSYLHLVGAKDLARPANRVVFGMGEVVDVVNIGPDLWSEELRIKSRGLGARIAVEPSPIGNSERLCACCML